MPPRIVVLGLGNVLLRDEGLGVCALEALRGRYALPPGVACVDGGVLGLDLLAYVEDPECLLVLDAVVSGRPPGTLVRLEDAAVPCGLSLKLSPHQLALADILALSLLRGTVPPRLVVWGMEPADLRPGFGLSGEVEARLDALVEAAACELRGWGVAAAPREPAAPVPRP